MKKTFTHNLIKGGAIQVTASYTWDGSAWALNDDEGIVPTGVFYDDLSWADQEAIKLAAEHIASYLPEQISRDPYESGRSEIINARYGHY